MNLRQAFQPVHQPTRSSIALLITRLVVGTAFIIHGWTKIQTPLAWTKLPIPGFFQALAAISEFGGGIVWVLGFLMPLASFGIGVTMAVAVYSIVFVFNGVFVNVKGGGSYELPSTFFCVAVIFLLLGPGKFSLDKKLFGEKA